MDYLPIPNPLLEALAYLGRKAGGYSGQYMADRMTQRGVKELDRFWAQFAPIGDLTESLDRCVAVEPQALEQLFSNLPGFPYSTIGAYSPAFLLFYPVLNVYDGDFSLLMEHMRALSPGHVARHLMLSLGLCDDLAPVEEAASGKLMDSIRSLDIPSDSKLILLDIFHRYDTFLEGAAACLAPTLEALDGLREELASIALAFGRELEALGLEDYLRQTSSLSLTSGMTYHIRPFLFGMDTNLSLDPSFLQRPGEVLLYSGVMRRCLLEQLSRAEDESTEVYTAIKLLGDRTRFDILCFLRDRSAYGQELSDQFGLARNTIHHHMSKLSNAGLITYTVDGNRVYYAVDKQAVDRLLTRQRHLLLGDYRSPDCLT